MAPSKCYGTTAFALVTILVIFAMFASVSSCTDRARYSGGDDYLVFGAGSVHSIEGTELVIQTDNSPRYTDAGKQTLIWPNQRQAFPNQSWDKSFLLTL